MKKCFIHVGLHKTATTSLQDYIFPHIQGNIVYFGRSRFQYGYVDLCCDIQNFCYKKNVDFELLNSIKHRLLVIDSDVLISDEWLTSDYSGMFGLDGCVWQEKLRRIKLVFDGFDVSFFCVIRPPDEGLFSQYLEFLQANVLDRSSRVRSDYIFRSNDSRAYDYKYLNETLGGAYFLKFENVTSPKGLEHIYKYLRCSGPVDIPHVNSKRKAKNQILVEKRTLATIFLRKFIKIIPNFLLSSIKRNKVILSFWDYVIRSSKRTHGVDKLSDIEVGKFRKYYADSYRFYDDVDF